MYSSTVFEFFPRTSDADCHSGANAATSLAWNATLVSCIQCVASAIVAVAVWSWATASNGSHWLRGRTIGMLCRGPHKRGDH